MIRLEPRTYPSRLMSVLSPVLALAITVVIAAALFALVGKDPARGLSIFLLQPWNGLRAVTEIGVKATPIALCALGLVLCFRSNVWNIGAEGQFILGGIAGGGLALLASDGAWRVTPWTFFPAVVLAGALGGALWASAVAWIRDRFHANEILVSLMLVYVADLFLSWLVFGPWRDPHGFNFPQTRSFEATTAIPRIVPGLRLHHGLTIAVAAAVALWLFMFRTHRGLQLQVGGPAPAAARYAGFSSRAALWTSLLVSGALAGVAGALEVVGPMGQLTPYVSQGYGFTGIIVAFVGRLHPLGCLLGSVLLATFVIGGELAQSRIGLPSALSGVFQGVLLISLLACDGLIGYRIRFGRRGGLGR